MKRYLLIFCILVVALSSFFLLFMRYGVAASEEFEISNRFEALEA